MCGVYLFKVDKELKNGCIFIRRKKNNKLTFKFELDIRIMLLLFEDDDKSSDFDISDEEDMLKFIDSSVLISLESSAESYLFILDLNKIKFLKFIS